MREMDRERPTFEDVEAAARRLQSHAVETPLIEHPLLNARANGRVLLKAENLQRTGSFKFRGAYNKISQLSAADVGGGIVATSSGNHAQGVAAAAKLCGFPVVIIMPSDAPRTKIERTRKLGAEVITFDRATGDRDAIAAEQLKQRGGVMVHPFDDFDVIAGQGTVGLEIIEQATALGADVDQVLVCCGGGGLSGGVATAVTAEWPGVAVHTVEPVGFDDFARSLVAGKRVANARASGSICDAILSREPGQLTFEIGRHLFSPGLTVTDDEAIAAVAFAFHELRMVVEPGGAVALAAALFGKIETAGRTTVCVISGGNIDQDGLIEALKRAADQDAYSA